MRKITVFLLSFAVAFAAARPVASQARLDIGAIVPRGAGVGSSTSTSAPVIVT